MNFFSSETQGDRTVRCCFLVRFFSRLLGVGKRKSRLFLAAFLGPHTRCPSGCPLALCFSPATSMPCFLGLQPISSETPLASLLTQPFCTVPHLGRWLVLFQLPPDKGGFHVFPVSFGRKTASEPFHASVAWEGPGFMPAGSPQSCPTTQHAASTLRSNRARIDAPLVLRHFWPGAMSHSRAKRPICHLLPPDMASDRQLSHLFYSDTGAHMFRPKLCTETSSFQTKE